MKILYGVQGTGNGHITRARAMAKAFAVSDIQVDFLFSGRAEDRYFDMACFGDYRTRHGLTFQVERGRVNRFKTALKLHPLRFWQEVRRLDVNGYDLVLSDFEPVCAWAARKRGVPSLGIGHQYVFEHPVPQRKADPISAALLRRFAPVDDALAVHWHHFDCPILPPIVEPVQLNESSHDERLAVVYLPFESAERIARVLAPLNSHRFAVYHPEPGPSKHPHIHFHALSRSGFLRDLHRCDAVIANAGFELSSEALQLGKRLLVKPLDGQVEQYSNALALEHLGYGTAVNVLHSEPVQQFLQQAPRTRINFPDVASHIVEWLASGMPERDLAWYRRIWADVQPVQRSHTQQARPPSGAVQACQPL